MFSRIVRATLLVTGVALAGFHGYLFAAQAAEGRLEDPWLILRWIVAAALVIALAVLRRSGESILGRKGIAIWVLAALLHGPTVAGNVDADFTSLALPETVAASVLQLMSSAVLAIGLLLLASLLAARRRQSPSFYAFFPAFSAAGPMPAGESPQFSPRPPPLRR
jgi:hypothetical protein